MNIITYIEMILINMLGVGIPYFTEVTEYYSNISNIGQIFAPAYFISAIIYISASIGLFQLCVVFPFRLLKKLIRYPSRKACEK